MKLDLSVTFKGLKSFASAESRGARRDGQGKVSDKEVKLILTRSIRRKLAIVLAVVFVMVVLLSVAGVSALMAYQGLASNLRISQEKDLKHSSLESATTALKNSLIRSPEQTQAFQSLSEELDIFFDDYAWDLARGKIDKELSEYYAKMDHDSGTRRHPEMLSSVKLSKIRLRLGVLDRIRKKMEKSERLFNLSETEQKNQLNEMLVNTLELLTLVKEIRNPGSVFDSSLRDSDKTINWLIWLIGVPTMIVVGLFVALVFFCYRWILTPVRRLHAAASRVASGDYSYRLKLKGRDEMVELAEMFNKMTERFQTDKTKLDREVEERSRQLIRNERLAGVGFLASGIAHEINNPLQAIANAAESLTGRLKDGSLGIQLPADDHDLLSTYLGMIDREASRCQQITARVLDFARGTNGPKTRQDLTKVVAEVLDMVTHMSKLGNRKLVFDRSKPHFAEVSAAEMKQVVLNLVANGLESMQDRGTMTIQIDDLVDELVLSVQDDGCGMTAATIQNLYEPFFTEKKNGKGTGLGLSITHRIVGDHGGRIEATSDGPGCGSTFRVHLPRCAKAVKSTAA